MSEAMHSTSQEFWRPPAVQTEIAHAEEVAALQASACRRCGMELMVEARFCHVCGASRRPPATASRQHHWARFLQVLRMLEFHSVKAWFGLSTASLVAFLIGAGCLLAAITVGVFYSIETLADFQAIQLWRIEWLLAALAAFVAGILLKRVEPAEK